MRLSNEPTNKRMHKEAKTSKNLQQDTAQGTIIRYNLQEL